MKVDRGTRLISIIAICIAILGISIAYASLSQSLSITGNATVQGSGWVVRFDTTKTPIVQTTGNAIASNTNVTISNTDITIDGVKLVAPGDSISVIFDVINDGDINAKLSTVTNKSPTFTGSGAEKATDETLVADNWHYTINYYTPENGENPAVIGGVPQTNDELAVGDTKTIIITITFMNTATDVPNADVIVSGFGTTLLYIQD